MYSICTVYSSICTVHVQYIAEYLQYIAVRQLLYIYVSVNGKLPCKKLWRLRMEMEYLASIFTLTFGTIKTAVLSAIRAGYTEPSRTFLGMCVCYRPS
jgi:hypothetical protein